MSQMDDNLFMIHVFFLGERNRVLLIEDYDGSDRPDSVKLYRIQMWAHIQSILELCVTYVFAIQQ